MEHGLLIGRCCSAVGWCCSVGGGCCSVNGWCCSVVRRLLRRLTVLKIGRNPLWDSTLGPELSHESWHWNLRRSYKRTLLRMSAPIKLLSIGGAYLKLLVLSSSSLSSMHVKNGRMSLLGLLLSLRDYEYPLDRCGYQTTTRACAITLSLEVSGITKLQIVKDLQSDGRICVPLVLVCNLNLDVWESWSPTLMGSASPGMVASREWHSPNCYSSLVIDRSQSPRSLIEGVEQ